jgi:hypothetical protein
MFFLAIDYIVLYKLAIKQHVRLYKPSAELFMTMAMATAKDSLNIEENNVSELILGMISGCWTC